jgi:hypothetical protein
MQGVPTRVSPSGQTAKTLILVGLILQGIFVLFLLGFGALLLIVFIGIFLLAAGALGLIWLILVYLFSYQPAREGKYEAARTPTLVFTILSFLTLSIIPAILYLIAYVKLGDAVREITAPIPAQFPPGPPRMQVCLKCGSVREGPGAFCAHCGTPWPP